MIKINLLPHKKIKPIEKGVLRLRAIIVGATVILALALVVWFYLMTSKISDLKEKSVQTTKQLESLKAKIKEVEGYEKSRLEFEKKLGVIKELQNKKVPLTPLLDEVNKAMIKEVWLTSLTVTDASFTMDAMAKEDKKNVDVFAERLKGSPLFKDVTVSDAKEVPSNNPGVKAFSFRITGKLAGFGQTPAQPEKGNPEKAKPA